MKEGPYLCPRSPVGAPQYARAPCRTTPEPGRLSEVDAIASSTPRTTVAPPTALSHRSSRVGGGTVRSAGMSSTLAPLRPSSSWSSRPPGPSRPSVRPAAWPPPVRSGPRSPSPVVPRCGWSRPCRALRVRRFCAASALGCLSPQQQRWGERREDPRAVTKPGTNRGGPGERAERGHGPRGPTDLSYGRGFVNTESDESGSEGKLGL